MSYLIFSTLGFISGSILYSYIVCLFITKKDITKDSDDKNPGAANVFKTAGKSVGILCLLLDILKGFLPLFFAYLSLDYTNILFAFVLAAPVLGHAFSPFAKFGGGKAIAVSFGALLGIALVSRAVLMLAFIFIFFSAIVVICPHRIRVIVTFVCFVVFAAFFERYFPVTLGVILISIIVIIKHVKKPSGEQFALYFFKNKSKTV